MTKRSSSRMPRLCTKPANGPQNRGKTRRRFRWKRHTCRSERSNRTERSSDEIAPSKVSRELELERERELERELDMKQEIVLIDLSALFHPAWRANENGPVSVAFESTI